MDYKIIVADLSGGGRKTTTREVFQYAVGQVLRISGLDLPASYRVDFSNEKDHDYSKPQIGGLDGVDIPDEYFQAGKPVYAFLVLSDGENDSATEFMVHIPVRRRPKPTNYQPTEVQQSVIDQTIAAANAAKEAAEAAEVSAGGDALKAEGYALGTQGGEPVDSDSPYYHNNAAYHAGQAADSADAAGRAKTAAETAQGKAEAAEAGVEADALKAEGYALGKQNGSDVGSGSPYYHNNAKYYADQAAAYEAGAEQAIGSAKDAALGAIGDAKTAAVGDVNSAGVTQVGNVNDAGAAQVREVDSAGAIQKAAAEAQAQAAARSAAAAADDVLKAEGYALGKQNGSDVGSGSPYYHNNAKYYADQAADAAAHLVIDPAMDENSTNAVQNKVITGEITNIYSILTATGDDMYRMMLESGVPYHTVMRSFLLANGVAALTDLSSLLDRWYALSRIGWSGGVRFDLPAAGQSMSSDGSRTGNNIGLSCTPSTRTTAGQDDYAENPLFAVTDCNVTLDSSGKPHISSIDLEGCGPVFTRTDPTIIVGVLQMTGWMKRVEDENGWGIDYTDEIGADGFEPLPEAVDLDGTVRTWVVHGKYSFGNNWSCCSGVKSKIWNVSHNSQLTGVHTQWGNRYCGGTSADDAFLKLMLWLKYARLDSDRVLHGCNNYNYEYQPALAESGVERILLTTAQAANILVGSAVVLAESKRAQSNIVDRCKVTKVETVNVGGTDYGAVYVDNGGVTFNTTTDLWLSTIAWWTGTTDDVLGNDGGIDPSSDKYPVKLQGIEYMLGFYEVMGDTILSFETIDSVKCQVANVCRDASKLATSVTSDYITCAYGVPRPASAGWTWPKRLGFDPDLPEVLLPSVVDGSSSTGTRDGFYEEADTATGLREWLRFGSLSSGVGYAGLSCGLGSTGLPPAGWDIGGRLSVTGTRGEFQAAA